MRLRERLPCAVGNVFNDTYRQLQFSFAILFLMKVIKLSASQTGLILLIIQISDALISPLTGYLGDRVDLPFVARKIGRRKSWHLLATILMAISVPLLYNRCFLCDISQLSWLPLVYYGIFGVQLAVSFNIVEINHLAYITTVAESVEECTALNALRTMFSFVSGVYVYVIAWTLLGRDSTDSLGPNHLSDFVHLSWIVTGTGVLFALVFHIGTKKPQKRLRRRSTHFDFRDAGGVFFWTGLQDKDSRKTSIAHGFVDMLMAPLHGQNNGGEESGRKDTAKSENNQRRKSLLQKFLAAIFHEDEGCPGSMTDTETDEEKTGISGDGDSKAHAVSELRHLGRDRKISILTKVIEEVVSRSTIKQLEMSTSDTGNNLSNREEETGKTNERRRGSNTQEHKSMVFLCSEERQSCSSCEEQQSYSADNGDRPRVTQQVLNDKEEAFETQKGRECGTKKDDEKQMALENNKELRYYSLTDEGYTENIQELLVSSKQRTRKNGNVSVPDHGKLGLTNFGFDSDGKKDIINGDIRKSTSDLRKNSVTFSAPESPVLRSEIYEERETGLNDYKSTEEPERRMTETRSEYPEQCFKSVEDGDNLSAPADHPKVLCHIDEKKHSKTLKAWIKDPNLYRVAIIFTCSRLAQDTVSSYLPLYLLERLQFPKEATAYFPLVLLTSATVCSTICDKLNRKIGSKISYLLAALLVMGGCVWSYFQTTSIRQSTYAPVVLMGSGLSIMYVMALTFITELIGEHKETSGSVISIITIIARMSSGGLVMFIQELYPEEGNEAISSYVHHVFAVTPGMLTLMGSLMVLFFQPSKFICRNKGSKNDVEAQEEESSADICAHQFSSGSITKPSVDMDDSHSVDRSTPQRSTEDTKL